MQGPEILGAAFGQHRHQIDHGLGPAQGAGDGFGIAQIGLNRMNLADAAERLEMVGEIGAARGDPDAPALTGEGANHMAADEA